MKRSIVYRAAALAVSLSLAVSLAGCGSQSSGTPAASASSASAAASQAAAQTDAEVVNIGSTSSLGTLNPLMIDSSWINMYAISLMFQPLVAANDSATYDYVLADDIASEDGLTYTIHLNENAAWSDGTPVTADDLAFTVLRLASSVVNNPNMMLYALEGTDDATGQLPAGATEFDGVEIVDDKTVNFHFKYAMSRESFMSGYAQYIFVLPSHVLAEVPEEELATYSWFGAPTVVDGPYVVTEYDNDHYISYRANDSYWGGTVNIPYVNIRIMDGSQLYAGLQSGELDVVPPLLGTIPQDDYESVLALEGVTAAYGTAYSPEVLFLNCESIDDVRIRQALLLALDRQTILDGLLGGQGQLYDAFAVPESPYSSNLEPTAYDAEAAAALVAQATDDGWDPATVYTLYLNSGDATLINAATVAQAYWQAVGLNVELVTVDLDTLMANATNGEGDMFGVQYTYATGDPSWDIQWVLGGWCRYADPLIDESLNTMWTSSDSGAYVDALAAIDANVQANVPLITLYVSGPLGAVSDRLSGCTASMYGCLNNIADWTITG